MLPRPMCPRNSLSLTVGHPQPTAHTLLTSSIADSCSLAPTCTASLPLCSPWQYILSSELTQHRFERADTNYNSILPAPRLLGYIICPTVLKASLSVNNQVTTFALTLHLYFVNITASHCLLCIDTLNNEVRLLFMLLTVFLPQMILWFFYCLFSWY